MFNPVIVVAIIVQWIVAKFSRIAGVVIGYIVTTGILLWGVSVYGEGDQIALFNIPLSEPVFLIACLVWYGFDTRELMNTRKEVAEIQQVLQDPLIQDEHVMSFYQTTLNAWLDGRLSNFGKGFEKEGRMQYEDFVKKYPPHEGSALRVLFDDFRPPKGEFLVGLGNLNNNGWFVLTNLRLIQRDGRSDEFKEVTLADVDSYQIKGMTKKTLIFKMKSGEEITFGKVQMYPKDKFLSEVIS